MKRRSVFFFICCYCYFGASQAPAAEVCSAVWRGEVPIAESVLRNKFVTDRDLLDYQQDLHPGFTKTLAALRPDQHWIDLGAGKARAQIQYLKQFRDLQQAPLATAVAYKLDRWFAPPKFGGRLQVKEGAFEVQPVHEWPQADLITDFFGVLSYTRDFTRSLSQALALLKVHGEMYIVATPWATQFKVNNQSLSLIEFLSSLEGLTVEGRFGVIKITKEKEFVQIPALELIHFKENAPPHRTFEEPRY